MSKTYHQGFIHENSHHLNTFTSLWGLYEWLRILFGLSTAPPAFQRFINQCLSGLRDSICIPYLDDMLCCGKTFDEHIGNLRTIFCRPRQFAVKLKAEKCILFKPEIKYLGKIISEKGYKDVPINTEAIEKLCEPPKIVGDLRNLLGIMGYYRRSIKIFSRKAKPIHEILSLPSENVSKSNHKLKKRRVKNLQVDLFYGQKTTQTSSLSL